MSDRLEEREENVRPEPEQEIPQLRTAEAEELEAQEAPEPEAAGRSRSPSTHPVGSRFPPATR